MSLGPDILIIRGGSMLRPDVEGNIRLVLAEHGRNGLCVKALIDREEALAGDRLVPHKKMRLTTPSLLKEAGLEPNLAATNDLGDRYQYTLWLPEGDPSTLVEGLWSGFRGPFPKAEASDDWTTEALRGLHHPGP